MKRFLALVLIGVLQLAAMTRGAVAVRVLAWDEQIAARKLSLVNGEGLVPILNMHPQKRTDLIRLKGEGGVIVRDADKGNGPDGKPVELRCVVAAELKHPLLLLLPDEKHPIGLRGMVIDDGTDGFGWGSYRFFNTTPKEMVVQFEQKAVRVPGGWKPVTFNPGGEPRGFGVRVALSESIEQPLYSAVWEFDPNVRTVVFMVPGSDPRLSPVAFKAIPEDKVAVAADLKEGVGEGR
jgi:hypothetical protein